MSIFLRHLLCSVEPTPWSTCFLVFTSAIELETWACFILFEIWVETSFVHIYYSLLKIQANNGSTFRTAPSTPDLHPHQQQSHQGPLALVALALEHHPVEESCVDDRHDKTIWYIPLLPPHHAVHSYPTTKVSEHDQENAESGRWYPLSSPREVYCHVDV